MQIIITWSNGMTSQLEVPVPEGATPLRASLGIIHHDTALRQRQGGRWECNSIKPGGALVGYCMCQEMAMLVAGGHPAAPSLDFGLAWPQYRRVERGLAGFNFWLDEHLERT